VDKVPISTAQAVMVRYRRLGLFFVGEFMRTLKSNKQRKHLWYASGGKCELCDKPLDATWEADHKIPWKILPETNVHEMQATCQFCNRQKGDSILSWRLHQEEMIGICNGILATTERVSEILVHVTPGGGKSALPVILAAKLIPTMADKICWIVPRDNLRDQGEKVFIDQFFIMLIGGHTNAIRLTQNEIDPSRGTQGYITTYQSAVRDPDLHRYEFDRHRYILFLDEPHHIKRGGPLHKALQPIVDRAALVVYASGTFERGDNRPIAFVPYMNFGDKEILDISPSISRKVVVYSRQDALKEYAIVPLHFEILDGRAEWIDISGKLRNVESLHQDGADHRAALNTALRTEYACELLDKCVTQWQAHKKTVYKNAKLLVIAPNISTAKKYKSYLVKELHLKGVGIATSDETEAAKKAIDRLRTSSSAQVLITVGMAYEGLDIPEITFIACLTNYRSKPWLEQCFARANRTAKDKQYGVIWGPDDPFFREIVEVIKAEQTLAARDPEVFGPRAGRDDYEGNQIIEIASQATFRSAIDLKTGKNLDKERTIAINEAANIAKLNGISTVQLDTFLLALIETGYVALPDDSAPVPLVVSTAPLVTPSQREANLKNSISTVVRRYCIQNDVEFWRINKEIKDCFGKKRDEMNVDELTQVWRYVQQRYSDDN
jgi:superfamily II DNA or RNA helicase